MIPVVIPAHNEKENIKELHIRLSIALLTITEKNEIKGGKIW